MVEGVDDSKGTALERELLGVMGQFCVLIMVVLWSI